MFIKIASVIALLFCCLQTYCTNVIRDNEVETVVKELGKPLFVAAGVDDKHIKVFVVDDNEVNAFTIDNNNIFIHLGLLQYSTEPYVLLGILAHEIAHISAGHILQRSNAINNLKSAVGISCVLGLISNVMIDPEIAYAIMLSGTTFSMNSFYSYSREQENMADRYALKYLDESGYDNVGVKEVFNYFQSIEPEHTEQYVYTHPLSYQRLLTVQNYKVKNNVKLIPAEKLLRFKRMLVKLDSLFAPIDVLYSKYNCGNDKAYVDAIISYRKGKIDKAIMQIDSLVQTYPYLYELKAEILYKAGRLNEAIESYEKSLQYLQDESGLVRFALSHTLLLHGNMKKAILYLEQIVSIEPNNIFMLKYLCTAYKHDSDMAMYYFTLAKIAFIENDSKNFIKYSNLAASVLQEGSIYLLQIEDMKKSSRFKTSG